MTWNRNNYLRWVYKITLNEYNQLLSKQGNKCAICHIDQSHCKRPFAVDHDHVDKEIRGLLCGRCNVGLGMFCDNYNYLKNAAHYLGYHAGTKYNHDYDILENTTAEVTECDEFLLCGDFKLIPYQE